MRFVSQILAFCTRDMDLSVTGPAMACSVYQALISSGNICQAMRNYWIL
jgi:hypothetical protein